MRPVSLFLMVFAAGLLVLSGPAMAQLAPTGSDGYQTPPSPIAQILDAPPTPSTSIDPTRRTMALFGRSNLPPIAELAEPMLKLGGYRINPRNNGPANSRLTWLTSITLQAVDGGKPREVALPAGLRFASTAWSPDGRTLAFLADSPTGLELWVVDAATASARRLTGPRINAAFGGGYSWLPDSSGLLVRLTAADRGAPPADDPTPKAPLVQESAGRVAPTRTYQDLLGGPVDEARFDYFFTAQLAIQPLAGGEARPVGAPGLILAASVSPDGRFLLQTRLKRPFSYVVPSGLFPADVVVTDLNGAVVHTVANLPLRDDIPPPFDSVAKGPRSVQWRDDKPATLVWVEALDEGDPRKQVEVRDRVFMLDAPFDAKPRVLIDLKERFSGVQWGRGDVALVYSSWWRTRHETRYVVNPDNPGEARVIVDRNYQGRYDDPGDVLTRANAQGRQVVQFTPDGKGVYLSGSGARREGEFPFLDRMDLASGKKTRLWQARPPYYEYVVGLLDDSAGRFLTRRESRDEVPQLFVRRLRGGTPKQITAFRDPAPQFAGVTKQLITYKRADGVELSGTLYLPAGYDPARDGRLPLVMWAYPTEFTDAKVAAEVVGSDNRFVRPGGASHLFLLTQGYAVLDDPSMPIIGANGAQANDTYVQQLVSSAQAAADKVVEMGVADPDRLAVGGHSYGAFMTANLLAHSDIFRTGIARSGAYNRTLTPFGFQAEERTYWEATDTYTEMSPFTHVRKIKEPILLIHGEADDNSGTFPVQSERFYAALKGNGGNVRYVVLPLEAHGYRARESVLHTLWEMTRWLDIHVKNARPPERK